MLSDWKNIRDRLVQNMKDRFEEQYNLRNLVLHLHGIIKNIGKGEN